MIDVGWLEEWISTKYVRSNGDKKIFKKAQNKSKREQKFGGKDG